MPGPHRWFLVLLAGALAALTACGDAGTPTAPTHPAAPPSTPPPPTVGPDGVDSRFSDAFWQELIYDSYEQGRRGEPLQSVSRSIDHQRSFAIDPTDMPADLRQRIHGIIPALCQQLTERAVCRRDRGRAGALRRGSAPLDPRGGGRAGVTVLRGVHQHHRPQRRLDPARPVAGETDGHDVGLYHTSDPSAVMHPRGKALNFNAREQYHAQLAYEIGPGAPYCGWPKTC